MTEIVATRTNHNCNLELQCVFFSRFNISLMTFIFMFPRIQLIGWMYQDFEVLTAIWSA